jgi:hypothetical protein
VTPVTLTSDLELKNWCNLTSGINRDMHIKFFRNNSLWNFRLLWKSNNTWSWTRTYGDINSSESDKQNSSDLDLRNMIIKTSHYWRTWFNRDMKYLTVLWKCCVDLQTWLSRSSDCSVLGLLPFTEFIIILLQVQS